MDQNMDSHTPVPSKQVRTDIVSAPARMIVWLLRELRWFVRVVASSCDRFYWDNGFSKAASLAYSTLLSIVPITALCFGFLASFAASKEYVPAVRTFIFKQFAPSTQGVDAVIQQLVSYSDKLPSLNVFVIMFLVTTSLLLLNSIEYVMNEIWQVYEVRSISHRVAIFCAIIVITPVLLISFYYTMTFEIQPFLDELGTSDSLNAVYTALMGFLIDFSAFFSLYYLVPKAPVKLTSATFGAFLAAILFGPTKKGFALYIQHFYSFSSYVDVYGATLAVIPIFIFWLYMIWIIILLGAESCFQAQYLPREGKVWKRSVLSVGDGKMVLAVQALVIIARAFVQGSKLPNELEIAETLGCSSVVLKPALNALEQAEILARGDSRDMPLTLMCSPDMISLEEIRQALYKSMASMHYSDEMSRLFDSFREGQDRATVTLADIMALPKSA